jgi:hypothetical protein
MADDLRSDSFRTFSLIGIGPTLALSTPKQTTKKRKTP